MAIQTRHGLTGWGVRLVGDFSGKVEASPKITPSNLRHGLTGWVTQGVTFTAKEPAPEPEPEVAAPSLTGGWLAGLRRRRLQQLAREAEEERRRVWRQKKRAQRRRQADLAELQAIYREAEGVLSGEAADALQPFVAPFGPIYDGRVTPVTMLDWETLLEDAQAVASLARALMDAADQQEEEEALLVLTLLH